MGRLRRTHIKAFGPTNVTTSIAALWSPAADRRPRLMGGVFTLTGAADTAFHITSGTVAAAGTVATIALDSGANAVDMDFGDVGILATGTGVPIGIKAAAGNGTVVATLIGREELG